MAYDESLARGVRAALSTMAGIEERKMFGGLAFMLDGNMCCCVTSRGLIVRVGADGYAVALAKPHAGPMDMTGRPMKGWVLVETAGLGSEAALGEWVRRGADFASTLPAK